MKKFTLLLSLLFAIISLQAQDYLISFAGTGASTTIGTVTVENLTQEKSISLLGSEVLHLLGTWDGINTISENEIALRIYPNPITDNSIINFVATASGTTNVELFDITGRRIGTAQNILTIGTHSYRVSGLRSGMYSVRISSPAYTYTGKLLSIGTPGSDVRINYLGNGASPVTAKTLKGASTETTMQYTTGDRLKFTAASDIYSTVVVDVPSASKTTSFKFLDCSDGDGNHYPVVQIGSQIWMAENLKTTKYNDGTSITVITTSTTGENLENPGYCWYNDDISNKNDYGALYNGYATNSNTNGNKSICPTGWHIPSTNEWVTLIKYLCDGELNMSNDHITGGKLKEVGITHWKIPSIYSINSSGFTAVPAGIRNAGFSPLYTGIGTRSFYWCSDVVATNASSSFSIFDLTLEQNYMAFDYRLSNQFFFSVRCLKD